jgi:ABC-type glutathione transport system ATPase component
LYLRHGECLALLGASGSGKTTLLEAMAGVVRPSAGRVRLQGTTIIDARRASERRFHTIQLVFQDASQVLEGGLTVREHLTRAIALRGRPKLWGPTEATPPPEEWMDRVGLPRSLLGAPADWLSAGEAQRVDLARSLVMDPDVILFDAPRVGGVDDDAGELMSLMLAHKERGKSFVVATSDPATARLVADRVAVLVAGRVVELGPAADLLDAPVHPATRALLAGALGQSDPRQPFRGCPHVATCPYRELPQCDEQEPALGPIPGRPSTAQGRHRVACYHPLVGREPD